MSRRGLSLALLAGLSLVALAATPASPPAEILLTHGAVYTVDGARSWAEAVGIADGRIVFVGTDAASKDRIGPNTRVVDLAGKMVLPAFHDSHVHPILGGVDSLECNLNDAATPAAALDAIRSYAAAHPDKTWIRGTGWALTLFPDGNPSKALLDSVVSDRPVFLWASDGHSAWVNSKALSLAGVTRATPDPAAGRIERDPVSGEPSGTLRESAADLVGKHLPARTATEQEDGLRARAEDRQPIRADRSARGERLGGGSPSVRRAGRAGRADRARLRVAAVRHGQGCGRGSEADGASEEVRRQASSSRRRQDLRRRRPGNAYRRGSRALCRVSQETAASPT